MTVLDVCLCLQTLSDAIISFSFKLACCSFQRGVSEDRTEERAFFLPTVAARLSVISKSRPGGKRVRKEEKNPASSSSSSDLAVWFFFVWKLPIHVRRVKAPQVPCIRAEAEQLSGSQGLKLLKKTLKEKHAAEETASAPALGRYCSSSSFTLHLHHPVFALFSYSGFMCVCVMWNDPLLLYVVDVGYTVSEKSFLFFFLTLRPPTFLKGAVLSSFWCQSSTFFVEIIWFFVKLNSNMSVYFLTKWQNYTFLRGHWLFHSVLYFCQFPAKSFPMSRLLVFDCSLFSLFYAALFSCRA